MMQMDYKERRVRIRDILGVHPKLKDYFADGYQLTAHEVAVTVAQWASVESLSVDQALAMFDTYYKVNLVQTDGGYYWTNGPDAWLLTLAGYLGKAHLKVTAHIRPEAYVDEIALAFAQNNTASGGVETDDGAQTPADYTAPAWGARFAALPRETRLQIAKCLNALYDVPALTWPLYVADPAERQESKALITVWWTGESHQDQTSDLKLSLNSEILIETLGKSHAAPVSAELAGLVGDYLLYLTGHNIVHFTRTMPVPPHVLFSEAVREDCRKNWEAVRPPAVPLPQ